MAGANKGKRRAQQAAVPVVVIDVQSVSNFAFNAGLTVDEAQRVLLEAIQWRYPVMRCSLECGEQPHVVVDHAWDDRTILYCTGCGLADLWV